MAALQGNKVLAGAGVVVIEEPFCRVLRWPNATGPKLYVILHRFDLTNRSWSKPGSARGPHKPPRHLPSVGVHLADIAFAGMVDGVHGCFVGVGGPIGAASSGGSQDQLLAATKNMQETQMSFNLQYLQSQSPMQPENRSYTAVSNIMKTRHDTVKNSISNVR